MNNTNKSFGSYVDNFRENRRREAEKNNVKCLYTGQDVRFMAWMSKIEQQVVAAIGVGLTDLPDEDFMMMFEDGYLVDTVTNIIIDNFYDFMNMR